MGLDSFEFLAPETLAEAFGYLQGSERAALLAGGTDLVPLLCKSLRSPKRLISLDGIEGLDRIEMREPGLFMGAMTTLRDLASSKELLEFCPALATAARMVASPQIRNRGTIGGNILQDRRCVYFNQSRFWRQSIDPCFKTGGEVCHQRPKSTTCRAIYYSDLAPVLISLGARVECYGAWGIHDVPISDFISRHISRNGVSEPGPELVTGFILPRATSKSWVRFAKQGVRSSIDFAVLNVALKWSSPGPESEGPQVSLIVGAMAPEPVELNETQALIQSTATHTGADGEEWARKAVAEAHEKSDLIMDTGLSLSARRKALGLVGLLVEQLNSHLSDC
jgi:4-hydroxybenzoyl-CoA reductase subunit beta